MKKLSSLITACLLTLTTPLFGVIIETAHFSEILHHATPETLVLLDVDDTLLIPTQTLGNDVWFQCRYRHHLDILKSPSEALEKALAEWEAVRHLTKVKIVEAGSEAIIEKMQKQGIPVMGLTTQGLALATRTAQQLLSLQIDLTKTAPSKADHYFDNGHGVLFHRGLLFTAGTPKGKAIMKFCELINLQPKHIVFINDKATHLRDVEETVESHGIVFTGLRYSHEDQRVAAFNKHIADIQWRHSSFERILSDQEAMQILMDELVPTIE